MSDHLGCGRGGPTESLDRLFDRDAEGGGALSINREIQCTPNYVETPGKLVLGVRSVPDVFNSLAHAGSKNPEHLWLQAIRQTITHSRRVSS